MKKIWTILGIVAGLVVIALLWIYAIKSPFEKRFIFDRITYKDREYNLGNLDSGPMTLEGLKANNFGDDIPTGVFYHGREIYVRQVGPEYAGATHTVIFLKQKNSDLFDIYSLVGGP